MIKFDVRRSMAAVALTTVFAANVLVVGPASANKLTNEVAKHPTVTGTVAGVATTKALEHKAAYDKAHGKKLNWAERHPKLSGIGVGLVTRHEIKKHMHPHN